MNSGVADGLGVDAEDDHGERAAVALGAGELLVEPGAEGLLAGDAGGRLDVLGGRPEGVARPQ